MSERLLFAISALPNLSHHLPRQQARKQQCRRIHPAGVSGRVIGKGRDACHGVTMTKRTKRVQVYRSFSPERTDTG